MMALTQGGVGWQGLGEEAGRETGGEAGEESGEESGEELEALGEPVMLIAIPGTSIKIHIRKTTVVRVLYRSYGNQSLVSIG